MTMVRRCWRACWDVMESLLECHGCQARGTQARSVQLHGCHKRHRKFARAIIMMHPCEGGWVERPHRGSVMSAYAWRTSQAGMRRRRAYLSPATLSWPSLPTLPRLLWDHRLATLPSLARLQELVLGAALAGAP